MTLKQRNIIRTYLGISDQELLKDADIDIYLDASNEEDKSSGDDHCISLLACSKIAQSNKWNEVIRQADGTTFKSADTFEKLLWTRMKNLGKTGFFISDTDY